MSDVKPIYICDPDKHKLCRSKKKEGWCGVECFCTTDPKKAVDPEHKLSYEEYTKEETKRKQNYIKERIKRGDELD